MPNIGGPKQRKSALLASVVTSVITYAIAIWGHTLERQASLRKVGPVYRRSALRVASAFRTVSTDAVCVIAGMLPIRLIAEERRSLYRQKGLIGSTPEESRTVARRNSMRQWQMQWDDSKKGRWTHRLIPQLNKWVNRSHGEVDYYLTQMLSGHGCFRSYLRRFKHDDSAECPKCPGVDEDAEHVIFVCPRFREQRNELEETFGVKPTPETLVELMMQTDDDWIAVSCFAKSIMCRLREEEQHRREARATPR